MNYSTILFDFDGTLTYSLDAWLVAFQKSFASMGKTVSHETIIERCFYRDFEEVELEFGVPKAINFGEMVELELGQAYEQLELFVGVRDVLQDCQSRNIEMAVVTSAPGKQVEKALGILDISHFFDFVIHSDHFTNYKPHPEPVLIALQKLDATASDALFVGDSIADLLAGRAAGTKTALFFPEEHKRFYNLDELMGAKPDFVFKDYGELASYLGVKTRSSENTLPASLGL